MLRLPVDQPGAPLREWHPQQKVLSDRQVRNEHRDLMHEPNSMLEGFARVGKSDLLTREQNVARIRRVVPGEHADQGRFASPVLAD